MGGWLSNHHEPKPLHLSSQSESLRSNAYGCSSTRFISIVHAQGSHRVGWLLCGWLATSEAKPTVPGFIQRHSSHRSIVWRIFGDGWEGGVDLKPGDSDSSQDLLPDAFLTAEGCCYRAVARERLPD